MHKQNMLHSFSPQTPLFNLFVVGVLVTMALSNVEVEAVTSLQVEGFTFPAKVNATGSCRTFILGGAGVRGIQMQEKFVKFTAIGVYLEEGVALKSLAAKWMGKTAAQLSISPEFYSDIFTGPFEKLTQVTFILPLTGQQYSEKLVENCVAYLKSVGSYTAADKKDIQQFKQVFKNQNFPPGSSIFFTQSPCGSLTISFSKKHNEIPREGNAVINNKPLSQAVLESIIGQNGVSPATKQSLAKRISELLKYKPTK